MKSNQAHIKVHTQLYPAPRLLEESVELKIWRQAMSELCLKRKKMKKSKKSRYKIK